VSRLTLALQATDQQIRTLCEEKMTRTEFTLQSASPKTEQTWTIGREECDVQMGVFLDSCSKVSRKHGEITVMPDGTWTFKHLGEKWPTWVDRQKVQIGGQAKLTNGTTVVFGDERFTFVCRVDTSAVADKAKDPSSLPDSLFPDDNKAMTFAQQEQETEFDPMKAALEWVKGKNRILVEENSNLLRQLLDVERTDKALQLEVKDLQLRVAQDGKSRTQIYNRLALAEQSNGEYEKYIEKLKERIRALEEGNEAYKKEAADEHAKARETASVNEQLQRKNEQLKRKIEDLETESLDLRSVCKDAPTPPAPKRGTGRHVCPNAPHGCRRCNAPGFTGW
jgi:pSer/pThr/pTyr-binding forkhead associated (FHA) protein